MRVKSGLAGPEHAARRRLWRPTVIGERALWTVGGIYPLTQPLAQITLEHCVRFKDKRVRPGRS